MQEAPFVRGRFAPEHRHGPVPQGAPGGADPLGRRPRLVGAWPFVRYDGVDPDELPREQVEAPVQILLVDPYRAGQQGHQQRRVVAVFAGRVDGDGLGHGGAVLRGEQGEDGRLAGEQSGRVAPEEGPHEGAQHQAGAVVESETAYLRTPAAPQPRRVPYAPARRELLRHPGPGRRPSPSPRPVSTASTNLRRSSSWSRNHRPSVCSASGSSTRLNWAFVASAAVTAAVTAGGITVSVPGTASTARPRTPAGRRARETPASCPPHG